MPVEYWLKADHFADTQPDRFGNIGRCLYYNNELQSSIHFYARSFQKLTQLKKNSNSECSTLNLGYAALWIGESLQKQGSEDAKMFFKLAYEVWNKRAPHRAEIAASHLDDSQLSDSADSSIGECSEWVSAFLLDNVPVGSHLDVDSQEMKEGNDRLETWD